MSQIMTRVSEVMTKTAIFFISSETSVEEAARRMKAAGRGCVIVVERKEPVGIITERDIVQRVVAEDLEPRQVSVSQIMSRPLITVGPEALVTDAARIMIENRIRRLPVVEGTELVGMITVTDFAKYLKKEGQHDLMLAAMARAALMLPQAP